MTDQTPDEDALAALAARLFGTHETDETDEPDDADRKFARALFQPTTEETP